MPKPGAAVPFKTFFEVPRDLLSRKGIETRCTPRGLTGTLIVGDDTGLIKVVSCKQQKVVKLWGQQNPYKRIQKLHWAHPPSENIADIEETKKEFIAVLSNGDIRLYNAMVGTYSTRIKQETDIQGVYVMQNPCATDDSNKERMLWSVNEKGDCRLWGLDYDRTSFEQQYLDEHIRFPTEDMIFNKLPTRTGNARPAADEDSFITLLKSRSKKNKDSCQERGVLLSHFNVNNEKHNTIDTNTTTTTAETDTKSSPRKVYDHGRYKRDKRGYFLRSYGDERGHIKCIKGHYDVHQFPWLAIAGCERPVEIYDFNKQKCIFRGEHHYHYLGYQHEVSINDIDWGKKSVNPWLCAAVTQQSELKLYDVRTKKSIFAQRIGDYALNKVVIKSKKKVLIGDANANIWEFNYLQKAKDRGYVYRRYRGFVGAIKDFAIHPTRNLLASVGLGRYAVIHRFNHPHLPLMRLYLKQKLTAVLFNDTIETKYLPPEEQEQQQEEQKNNDLNSFLGDSDQEEEEEEEDEEEQEEENMSEHKQTDEWDEDEDEDDEEEDSEVDDDKNEYDIKHKSLLHEFEDEDKETWNEKLDGYDTDELQELLQELKAEKEANREDSSQPPLKKRKLND
eukprot:CAMPEP_0202687886 /NCGR_PEP_ID=MMETSP1385-20130828/3454_1 /ASSEMBLY_ACC=CAM_ASM_000861 /TAXON_ID=933848 /ORGANISM="Elphidium margaritaceum" /LENGTH=617 /DNA_ID=CAMNT_0049342739 /DNA_START=901 /DNA_END=2754 /DNA_ORIENTATION=-